MLGITGKERVGASAKDKNVFGVWDKEFFCLEIILNGKLRAWEEKDIKDKDNIKVEKFLKKYFIFFNFYIYL